MPRYVFSEPVAETPAAIREQVLASFDEHSGLDRHDRWWIEPPEPLFRSVRPVFYRDVLFTELRLRRSFSDGHVIASYLVALPAPDGGDVEPAMPSLLHLDGSSPPLHELNSKGVLLLDTQQQALEYLIFFCANVWGSEGGFWVCSNPADLPWKDSAPGQRASIDALVTPPTCEASLETWKAEATILYSRRLFKAKFTIQRNGMVGMEDDQPLVERPLDVWPDRRLNGFRVVPDDAVRESAADNSL